jgi:hypothetical protein
MNKKEKIKNKCVLALKDVSLQLRITILRDLILKYEREKREEEISLMHKRQMKLKGI